MTYAFNISFWLLCGEWFGEGKTRSDEKSYKTALVPQRRNEGGLGGGSGDRKRTQIYEVD
jgi:hypothetical protein